MGMATAPKAVEALLDVDSHVHSAAGHLLARFVDRARQQQREHSRSTSMLSSLCSDRIRGAGLVCSPTRTRQGARLCESSQTSGVDR